MLTKPPPRADGWQRLPMMRWPSASPVAPALAPMRLWLALGILLCAVVGTAAAATPLVARYVAGEHYQVLPQSVTRPGDDIPVIEFFLYSCPHCYALDAEVTQWADQLPDDVAFRRVPVVFGNGGRFYARLFYTAQAFGVLERLHAKIFAAIHQQGRNLTTLAAARALFVANGVNGAEFARVFNSPSIDQKVARAAQLARTFRVRAVPSFGVAGRYWVSGRLAGSNEAMFDVVAFLLDKARAAH